MARQVEKEAKDIVTALDGKIAEVKRAATVIVNAVSQAS